jgi:hypothetical protein
MTTEARMNEPSPIRGRWTLCRRIDWQPSYTNPYIVPPGVDPPEGDEQHQVFEVVPVPDEQAIERAAKTLCEIDGAEWDDCDFKDIHRDEARVILAAALEQPDAGP